MLLGWYQSPKPTPRHHALLNNQDILATIFSDLHPGDSIGSSREYLIQGRIQMQTLATTCKSFKEPALDLLWISLDSLLPLIKLLPNLQVIDNAYYYHDSISAEGKFRRYASKIRVLDLRPVANGSQSAPAISPHLYTHISKELGGEDLFPNLRRLSMNTVSNPSNDFLSLSLLLPARLPSVEFSGDGLSSALFTNHCFPLVLRQLGRSLRCLRLKKSNRETPSSTLEYVLQFANLGTLDLQFPESSVMDGNALLKLGRALKRLTSLTLDLHFQSHHLGSHTSTEEARQGLFPKLKTFHAISRSGNKLCECIPDFLRIKMTHLTIIVCADISSYHSGQWKSLSEQLGTIPCINRLDLTESTERGRTISDPSVLHPLLRLPLVEFNLNVSVMGGWGGVESLIKLASPPDIGSGTLRRLRLPQKANATLLSLDCTAEKAPALEELSLGFQSEGGGTDSRFPSIQHLLSYWRNASPSQSQLRYLAIAEQKPLSQFNAEQYNDIAQLLDLMFPRLVEVKPFNEADRTAPFWKDHWGFIEHLRKMYKEIRVLRMPHRQSETHLVRGRV